VVRSATNCLQRSGIAVPTAAFRQAGAAAIAIRSNPGICIKTSPTDFYPIEQNQTSLKATRAKLAQHPIEEVGVKLRDMMPWIKKGALVDKTKN
jgi:hypothetical protein